MLTLAILSYNHPVITARCVSAALKFISAENVALLHNGTSPKHIETLKIQFPQIRHWSLEKNSGYSGGVNEIFRQGFKTSEWIFLLTNDTEITHWDLNTNNLQPGLYSPKVWLRKPGRIDYCGGLFDSRWAWIRHLEKPLSQEALSQGQYLYVPGTAFLLSQEVYKKLGGMDESLHTYWEDVDFGARATKQKIIIGFIPQIQLIHQGRKTTGKDSFYTGFLFQRNRFLISWRHCPWFLKWMHLLHVGKRLHFKWKFLFSDLKGRAETKSRSDIARSDHSRRSH